MVLTQPCRHGGVRRRVPGAPWATDAETEGETEGEGAMSESDFEIASTLGHGPGESTLFLPGDTVFWLPYALSELPTFHLILRDPSIIFISSSPCLPSPGLRPHAGLPHSFLGAFFQRCTISYALDLQDPRTPGSPHWRSYQARC
jgi:hypothetical protein